MKRSLALLFLAIACTGVAYAGTPMLVSDVWSRPANGTAVVYATLRNRASVPDRLLGATSPVATRIELHETFQTKMPAMSGMGSMGSMPMSGSMMSMKSVSSIPVPALGTTKLTPGGYHMMLDLRRDIKAGETIPLRLHFANAGWISTTTKVRPIL
jgi:copper(I)-binding protein